VKFANSESCRCLLIAEDDIAISKQLYEFFSGLDYQVDVVADGTEALAKAQQRSYGVVLADHIMPGQNGLDVLRNLSADSPDTSVVLMTGYTSLDVVVATLRLGACDIVIKPFSFGDLVRTIKNAFDCHRAALAYREMAEKLNVEGEVPPLRTAASDCRFSAVPVNTDEETVRQ